MFMTKRIIGIDYGTKRVGIAASDPSGKIAMPVSVITNTSALCAEVEKICHEYEADAIVIGESRDYSGKPNPILDSILSFKAEMEKRGFEVILELEFMSSIQAERIQGKNNMLDASAAAVILQGYLDRVNT